MSKRKYKSKRKFASKRKIKPKLNIAKYIFNSLTMSIILAILILLNGKTTGLAADNFISSQEIINLEISNDTIKAEVEQLQDTFIEVSEENAEVIEDTYENEAILISKLITTNNKIALTFDDCNNRANMTEILNILSENNIKATFFVTGDTIERYPDMLLEIVNKGNTIGNHSYTHSNFTKLTPEEIKAEVESAEDSIKEITGKTTKPLFRPPYGSFNDEVIKSLGELGYTNVVYWTIDTRDWSGISADAITQEVLTEAKPGAIVLMHASNGAKNTAEALPDIIKGLKEMGYEFVKIDE